MTRHQSAAWLMVAWTLLFAGLSACGSDTVVPPSDDAIPADSVTPDTAGGPSTASTCPEGYATLTMTVDDSANQTYSEGELLWTGSFSFDEATNTVVYATAWQPTDGPYPPLYDDGPISEGGHEPEGAIAGDHVFGVAVCYLAEQDRLLAYGVLNDDLRWIWLGPNGLLDVPADVEEAFALGACLGPAGAAQPATRSTATARESGRFMVSSLGEKESGRRIIPWGTRSVRACGRTRARRGARPARTSTSSPRPRRDARRRGRSSSEPSGSSRGRPCRR